jgi:hypothetical protein
MEIRPSLMIPAMVRAMSETVLPAVDPENKLAVEQARLVIGMLQLMSKTLPLLDRYDRIELRDYVALSKGLEASASGGRVTTQARTQMVAAREHAARQLEDSTTDASAIERTLLEVREKVSALVHAVHTDGDTPSRANVRRAVIEAARAETERARAWVLPQGWEAPGSVLPIESVLAEAGDRE